MIDLRALDAHRIRTEEAASFFGGSVGGRAFGAFRVPVGVRTAIVLATTDHGWDRVSVSLDDRCPTWEEMERIKHLTLGDDLAMQLHVQVADHVNHHPHCLHIWRPQHRPIPRPDGRLVGPRPRSAAASFP